MTFQRNEHIPNEVARQIAALISQGVNPDIANKKLNVLLWARGIRKSNVPKEEINAIIPIQRTVSTQQCKETEIVQLPKDMPYGCPTPNCGYFDPSHVKGIRCPNCGRIDGQEDEN